MVLISFDVDKDEFAVFLPKYLVGTAPRTCSRNKCISILMCPNPVPAVKVNLCQSVSPKFLGGQLLLLPGFAAIKTSPPATKCRGRHKMRQSGNILCPGTPQSSGTPKQVKAAKLGTSGDHKDNIAFKSPPPWSKYLVPSL